MSTKRDEAPAPEGAPLPGTVPPFTVGNLGVVAAGALETGRSAGVMTIGAWALYTAISGDLSALHKDVEALSQTVDRTSTELREQVSAVQGQVFELRNDVTRLQAREDVRDKDMRDKRSP